jgi:hypothetical protein
MNRFSTVLLAILFPLLAASCARSNMSPEKFDKLVSTPGDSIPLSGQITNFPFWPKAETSIVLKYEDGRIVKDHVVSVAKTINGKYIVFTMQSQLYQQPLNSIVSYNAESSTFEIWGNDGDSILKSTVVLNEQNRTYKSSASYGDGYTESGIGSWSDNEQSTRVSFYKNGTLIMTRDGKTAPIN